MDRELTLHIGVTKTGSTSIQHVLVASGAELRRQGIHYPTSPGTPAHNILPAVATDPGLFHTFSPLVWEGMRPDLRLKLFVEAFRQEMANLPPDITRCVISSETLATRISTADEAKKLRAFLAPYFASFKVIVYLRRQDSHVVSNYNQDLREGLRATPELPRRRPLGPFKEATLDYDALLSRFAAAFGRSAIVPRIFDRVHLVRGDVVADFLEVAGITLATIEDAQPHLRNPSLNLSGQSLLAAALARAHARPKGPLSPKAWQRLAHIATRDFPGRGWQPARAEAAAFLELFRDSNERVRRTYFPHLPALFGDDLDSLPEKAAVPGSERALDAALDVVLRTVEDWAAREVGFAMEKYRLLRRLNDRDGMRQALASAIKLAPDLPTPRLRMAELCLAEERHREASEHLAVAEGAATLDAEARRQAAGLRAKLQRKTERGARRAPNATLIADRGPS